MNSFPQSLVCDVAWFFSYADALCGVSVDTADIGVSIMLNICGSPLKPVEGYRVSYASPFEEKYTSGYLQNQLE